MTETLLLERLAAAVAERVAPRIPIEIDLWSASEIAAYLKLSERQVTERYAPLPDFPKAYRLPTPSGGSGHPRWKAHEVIAWAERYAENGESRMGRKRAR
jgi:ABC-type Fe3+ transport system substrate-binding protein